MRDSTISPADILIGFGHFDMRIPRQCGRLYREGYSSKILLSGGRGAGTADLKDAEGVEFERELKKTYPDIPAENIIVESESTNTGDNIRFSESILKKIDPRFCFEKGIQRAIAVACPYRQRRVWLCMKKLFPEVEIISVPPDTTFEYEMELYKSKRQDLILLIAGEMERIKTYPAKGFTVPAEIPDAVNEAWIGLNEALKS
jgi:uncharacterized SAM-binding protein YcdF (DUF218 family)